MTVVPLNIKMEKETGSGGGRCFQWRIQDFPGRETNPTEDALTYFWQSFCRKLHENERNLSLASTLDPPLLLVTNLLLWVGLCRRDTRPGIPPPSLPS